MKLFLAVLCIGAAVAIPAHPEYVNGRLVESYQAEQGQFIEGDILLPAGKTVADVRNGLVDTSYRWPGGVVPYTFGIGFSSDEIAAIESAFAEYAAKTCIRFVERTDENDYLRITNQAQGCFSYVGRIGGAQQLNYQSGSCITRFGTLLHEMYHALGFFHEQSRFDRDDYVTIVWDNIDPNYANNFDIYPQSEADGFGEAYDYGSMMHYPAVSFSTNGQDTIIPKDPNATIGQRVGFSEIDLLKVNKMYCQ